jgi:hypothetical protein
MFLRNRENKSRCRSRDVIARCRNHLPRAAGARKMASQRFIFIAVVS